MKDLNINLVDKTGRILGQIIIKLSYLIKDLYLTYYYYFLLSPFLLFLLYTNINTVKKSKKKKTYINENCFCYMHLFNNNNNNNNIFFKSNSVHDNDENPFHKDLKGLFPIIMNDHKIGEIEL